MIERDDVGGVVAAVQPRLSEKASGAAFLWSVLMAGCAANVDAPLLDEEMLGSASQAIGEAACRTVPPTATIGDGGLFRSATQYTIPGCQEAVVVEVAPFEFYGTISVRDVGAIPTNATQCQNLGMRADFFGVQEPPGDPVEVGALTSVSESGEFPAGGPCVRPSIDVVLSPIAFQLNAEEVEEMTKIRVVMRAGANILAGSQTRPIEIEYSDP